VGRTKNNYPVPHLGKIQATVRKAILAPAQLPRTGTAKTARETC
jgi:hypothetical protein